MSAARSTVGPGLKAPLYVIDGPATVAKRGGRILVTREREVLASAPLMCLSEVVLFGRINVTTPALHALLDADVPLVLLRSDGRARGRLEPPGSPHVALRQLQTLRCAEPAARLHVARAVVAAKLRNQRALLRARQERSGHADTLRAAADRLAALETAARDAAGVSSLLGIEGAGAGAYFRAFRLLAEGCGFTRRDRHGPDVVNALLNYCSALLREQVLGAITAAGLDPHASFFHTPMRGRPTLAFDLMEEWRPVLLEATVLALLGLGMVRPADCRPTDEGPRLHREARAAAVNRFRARLDRPARSWPPRPGQPTYGQCLRRQALRLRRWINGETDRYEPFRWR